MNKNGGKHVDKCKKIRNLCQNMWITLVIILVWILVGNVDMYVQASGDAHVRTRLQYDRRGEQKEGKQRVNCIYMADNSDKYLEKRGKRWYLKGADGFPIGGVQRIVPSKAGRKVFEKGYYYFEADGRLCTKKDFHAVAQTVGKKNFRGVYYFGGKNGKLYVKKGWITVRGKRYYLTDAGKRVTNKWKSGYYLQTNGAAARSKQTPDGAWVGYDGKKCAKNEVKLGKLKQRLESTVGRYAGSWSVYVKNLETGDVVNINECSMYSASTIKAFVMASVYNEISHGRLRETGTIQSLLRSMITVSSNDAYNSLVRYQGSSFVSGAAVVNRYLRANGYDKTGCHHTLHPASSASIGDGGRNMTSAKDCGVLLERIYKGRCVSKKYSGKMLAFLKQQQRKWKIPAGLPSGIASANKTGETSATQHDMAIVYGKKTDYVICVFSSGCGEGAAISGIRNVSRIVYDYLN